MRIKGEQWNTVRELHVAEAAAVLVGERSTGFGNWDKLGFGRGMNFDLSNWETELSEGVQGDAID